MREVIDKGEPLGEAELARHRISWFSEGLALGSETFLGRTLGHTFEPDVLKELPVVPNENSQPWYTLSLLRSSGMVDHGWEFSLLYAVSDQYPK